MKITGFKIENFKSIKELYFPIKSYGDNKYKSRTSILIGINECGKSSILNAISLINSGIESVDYDKDCFMHKKDDAYIDIYAFLELSKKEEKFLIEKYVEQRSFDKSHFRSLKIQSADKNVFCNSTRTGDIYNIELNEDFPFHLYIEYTETVKKGSNLITVQCIGELEGVNSIGSGVINEKNYEDYLQEGQITLTKTRLEDSFNEELYEFFNNMMPDIIQWKPTDNYLINETIDLEDFKDDTDINIPLKNIFKIYGKTSDDDIKTTIENALKSQINTDRLKDELGLAVTKHVNSIWKEHRVNFIISINGSDCQVHVEDKDKKYNRLAMDQRSDGFKHFISLLLSLSVQNKTSQLKNKIILIDEPEIHLHPSGIIYLKNELLKIGKNNDLIVSTHSGFLVDTNVPERQWIVTKEIAETQVNQVNETTSLTDEQVLKSAFGLNVFKELLPSNLLIVEGEGDKTVLKKASKVLGLPITDSIKSAKGATKAIPLASLLDESGIEAYFLFDDDKIGQKCKRNIEDGFNRFFKGKAFTLRNLAPAIPKLSTLEDLLPLSFTKDIFCRELNQDFSFDGSKPVLMQAKAQNELIRDNKQKLESVKNILAREFLTYYDTEAKLKVDCPNLVKLLVELQNKISEQ